MDSMKRRSWITTFYIKWGIISCLLSLVLSFGAEEAIECELRETDESVGCLNAVHV